MKIWADMSAPAHVLVLRPIIQRLEAEGHSVEVTSRDYAQTQDLLDLHAMPHTPIGRHGGASRRKKAYPPRAPDDRSSRRGVAAEKGIPARRPDGGDAGLRARPAFRPRPRPWLQRPGDR